MSDIDDLFDYDAGLDDVLKNLPSAQNKETSQAKSNNHNNRNEDATQVLGLDADLKVAKKRAPVAKLDEARLLSQKGIPKLRKDAKTKLKFKGKGHEFSDLGRLLNFYQLWLDDLYPRAKFADGLAMIEKLGHSKKIQIMRKEWIKSESPDYQRNSASEANDINMDTLADPGETSGDSARMAETTPAVDAVVDDKMEELLGKASKRTPSRMENTSSRETNDDKPPDDDLDMLLAEAEAIDTAPLPRNMTKITNGDVPPDDELEMLLDETENGMSNESSKNKAATESNMHDDSMPPDDDLESLLAESENIIQGENTIRKSIFNS